MPGADNPSEADFALAIIRATLGRIRTVMPAKVVTYDSAAQKVTVQPAVNGYHLDGDTDQIVFDRAPPIPNVPVLFLGGAKGAVTSPLQPGDPCTVVIAERSTDEWRSTGNDSNDPADPRRFDLTDAYCFPGGMPLCTPLPADAVHATDVVVWGADGVRLGGSTASDFVALSPLVEARLQALETAFNSHTHLYNPGALTPVVTPTPLPQAGATVTGDTASAKVRSL